MIMDCWHREIARSRTEAEVVSNASDFLTLWSPHELAKVTLGWRPTTIRSAEDIERMKKWCTEDRADELRELGDYLWHAAARIREIRRSA
jgi:hypothetical protein